MTAIVPARGGSKGFPGKNLATLGGVSLVGRAVRAALGVEAIDRTIISTDDAEIAQEARRHGAELPFMRPPELASDTASTVDVLLHLVDALELTGVLVVLQPTSPLRTAGDIAATLARLGETGAPVAVTVRPFDKVPNWLFHMGDGDELTSVVPGPMPLRRQDAPPAFELNGAVYAVRVESLVAHRAVQAPGMVGVPMPAERSVDIDAEADLRRAEEWLRLHGEP